MIPIRDSTWRGSTPHVTRALIVLNVLVFLAMLTLADTRSPTTGVLITTNETRRRPWSTVCSAALCRSTSHLRATTSRSASGRCRSS